LAATGRTTPKATRRADFLFNVKQKALGSSAVAATRGPWLQSKALVAILDRRSHSIVNNIITAPRNASIGAALPKIAALRR